MRKIYESGRYLLQIVEDVLSLSIGNKKDVKVRKAKIKGIDLFVQMKSYLVEMLSNANREKDIKLNVSANDEALNSVFNTFQDIFTLLCLYLI